MWVIKVKSPRSTCCYVKWERCVAYCHVPFEQATRWYNHDVARHEFATRNLLYPNRYILAFRPERFP